MEDARGAEDKRIRRERDAWGLVLLREAIFLKAWLKGYSTAPILGGTPPKTPLFKRALDHVSLFPAEVAAAISFVSTDIDELHELYRTSGGITPAGQEVTLDTVKEAAGTAEKGVDGLVAELEAMVGPQAYRLIGRDPNAKKLKGATEPE